MFSIVRSTAALGATLAVSVSAFMPAIASASEPQTAFQPIPRTAATGFVVVGDSGDSDTKNTINCRTLLPCEDVKSFCALMGGSYEPGSCTLPDWPPPPSRD